ncbi:DNA-3-methyladenine glycosylase 2 family protein [Ahrensia marina]|uniref:DNA-3-methyladenine glycosylase family protein n=1 Tax=Ahrensia marina TaxID=1514904 RepID=UPI0035CF7489
MFRCIECDADVVEGLTALRASDPALHRAMDAVDHVPLRRSTPDFAGLARIVIAQQVSVASAKAITVRTIGTLGALEAQRFADADDEALKACGLSRPKQRTLRAIADALPDEAAFMRLNALDVAAMESELVTIKGVGPWTAQIYMLFCVGHADTMPVGDLALQKAAAWALGLDERMTADALAERAEAWSPWRGVAARLLWSYHSVVQGGKSGIAI